MSPDPTAWRNLSPGDLSVELNEVKQGSVTEAVARSARAFVTWRAVSLEERKSALRKCQERLRERGEELARMIALEIGKPLSEARLELAGVISKFDLSFEDADRLLTDWAVEDGPHPGVVRRRPRGPAAVVAPFNFPLHLGHGATVAYLLAGNTVIFKPSPLAANVCAAYGAAMEEILPDGVFSLVQGWGETGRELCLHPGVRSVCFTGSLPVGTRLARDLAPDFSKSLALELGGVNCLIVCADADLSRAAEAAADGICLTAGQRCNATSRILVDQKVEPTFLELLQRSLERYEPEDPSEGSTLLGPLVSAAGVERYRKLLSLAGTERMVAGEICGAVHGKRGHYVRPMVCRAGSPSIFQNGEGFCPVAEWATFSTLDQAAEMQAASPGGLTASIFTESPETFRLLGDRLEVGNLYQNLPTTFSPSTLPFGGLRGSGNGKPGGRGFIRFAADEQAVQFPAQTIRSDP